MSQSRNYSDFAQENANDVLPGLVKDWGGFERFVADLNKIAEDVTVEHNSQIIDRQGIARKLDVVVRYRIGLVKHLVVCECKFWKTRVPREKVDAFITTIRELNASHGIMFSVVGFQSGAIDTARANNISLFKIREPNKDEWGAPGRFIDIYLMFISCSIGSISFPGAVSTAAVGSDFAINLEFQLNGPNPSQTEAVVTGGRHVNLETFLYEQALNVARKIVQDELIKGVPFFSNSGQRRLWKNAFAVFHPEPMRLSKIPDVFIPSMAFSVGVSMVQKRMKTDRAANYTFVVAVEDCIATGVTAATRRIGDAFTAQFPLITHNVNPSEALQNGSITTVWLSDIQPFDVFEKLAEGEIWNEISPD